MCDTETRVVMVARRVNVLHRKQKNRLTAMLSVLCLMLTGITPSGANASISGNIAITFSEAMNYAVNETTPSHYPEIYVPTNG